MRVQSMLGLALLGSFLFAGMASADPIGFSTTAQVNGGLAMPPASSVSADGFTFAYTATNNSNFQSNPTPNLGYPATYGTLVVSITGTPAASSYTENFSLNVNQSAPPGSPSSGSFLGTITLNQVASGLYSAKVVFTQNTLLLAQNTHYTVADAGPALTVSGFPASLTLQGNVTAYTPVPSSVWGGMGLLGLLGAGLKLRGRSLLA